MEKRISPPRNRLKRRNDFARNFPLVMLMIPGIIVLIINNYLPMLGVVIAFKKLDYRRGFLGGDWVGFDNFEFFLKTTYAPVILRNTILYNLAFIAVGTCFSVAIAIALNEIKNKRTKKIYQSIMILPYFLSWIVASYIGLAIMGGKTGFINSKILAPLGLDPIQFYLEKKYWPFILVFANIWKYGGYNAVVYLAAVAGLNTEYYEAAAIDGANRWKQIKHITLPLLTPVIIIMVLLQIGKIFNADFGLFYLFPMDSGPLYDVTNVIDTYVYRAMTTGISDFSMAAAVGLFQSVVGLIFILSSNAIVNKIDPEKGMF